ncbi:MAG: transketolase C-terminal domain-containing protein [Candidatus Promineifilaceae bacterium]|nr:transketolase C-terminal domain-containing protein [Candidatus Promineifilaceae bacterium]
MRELKFGQAVEDALAQAMALDERIIVFGEDSASYRRNLLVRFGTQRVMNTPISESALMGAAVSAAMAGLRPVLDLTLVDFIGVAMDGLLNHAAKIAAFSDGQWTVPMVVWAACGGGYGDGGQHEQSLWGWLAHIPGLTVLVPSTPADAGALMLAALEHDGPVIFLEHKLLADYWLDWMGGSSRPTVTFDVPSAGAKGPVPADWQPAVLGQARSRRGGSDLTMVSVGVGVHRAVEAANRLAETHGIEAEVIDLRSVAPLDRDAVCQSVAVTGRLLVVDEDYEGYGLSGELAAIALEQGLNFRYRRVCTKTTIPYARYLEAQTLPNVARIMKAALQLAVVN